MGVDYRNLPLGKQTGYSDRYDPSLLVAVPRVQTRGFMQDQTQLPFHGIDEWNAFELSWLDSRGKPENRCARLLYSAHSPAIVESKSLKLYLNSLNQSLFDSAATVQATIQADVANTVGATVQCELLALDDPSLQIRHWNELCIDYPDLDITGYTPDPALLGCDPDTVIEETLVSHLLRSLCPVTGQPDWASVRIHYQGPAINHTALLRYICSFRQHQGFHEQCIERLFCELWQHCHPITLSVEGRFTRRGGLDINPFRASETSMRPTFARQSRQ